MIFCNFFGRLGANAEVVTTDKGSFVTMRVAVDDSTSATNKVTSWLTVSIDKKDISDRFLTCLTKGTLVNVYGREILNIYKDRNGEPQIGRRVYADNVRLIPTSSSGETATSQTVAEGTTPTVATTATQTRTVTTSTVTTDAMSCGTFTQPTIPVVATTPSGGVMDSPEDDLPF